MAGREKASMGKRNKRPKENAESGKRMSILLLFWEMTELPLVNRWKGIRKFWWGETGPGARQNGAGRKAKQGRAPGKAGPGARQNRARCRHRDYRQRSPSTENGQKCRWKPFSLFDGTFLYCSIQSLKRGFWPVYGEAEGIMTYPYQKWQQKSALPALTGRFSVEQRGSWS